QVSADNAAGPVGAGCARHGRGNSIVRASFFWDSTGSGGIDHLTREPVSTRMSRHEVVARTTEIWTVHKQVLRFAAGILRKQASAALRLRSEAFRTMEQTWKSQPGGALESDDMVKTK